MRPSERQIALEIESSPRLADEVAAWPDDRPLAMFASHAGDSSTDCILLGAPTRRHRLRGPGTFDDLRSILDATPSPSPRRNPAHPSGRGFLVMLSYDLFRHLETTAVASDGAADDRDWPDAVVLRIDGGRLVRGDEVVDVGDATTIPPRRTARLDPVELGPLESDLTGATYESMVADVIERIHRGDCFQANIAQRFSARFRGSTRALALAAFAAGNPRHGALLECGDGRTVISMSPELFLEIAPTADGPRIVTGPIKGTRPSSAPTAELLDSEKDAAELAMIVDLMRNDLGRICDLGTVSVDCARRIETHRTVHHGVATVSGTLRRDVDLVDALRDTFPPGSVTGAPKVQAMRIIDELEPTRRGPYCGSIGWIDDDGWSRFNVAIRTIMCDGTPGAGEAALDGRLDYIAGCGIVAESEPNAEWRESLDKAAVLRDALSYLSPDRGPAVVGDYAPSEDAPSR